MNRLALYLVGTTLGAGLTACGSSSSGTTGGSCAADAEACSGSVACCTGLTCSPVLSICLTSQGSGQGSGPGVSATTNGGTPSSNTSSSGTTNHNTTSGQLTSTTSGGTFDGGTSGSPSGGTSGGTFDGGTSGSPSGGTSGGTFDGGTSGSPSGGTSGGTFDGGTSGGTSGGPIDAGYAGGCATTTYFTSEFNNCVDAGFTCSCGQRCTIDDNPQLLAALGGGAYCETPCTRTSDCPDPGTVCTDGSCRSATCATPLTTCSTSGSPGSNGFCQPIDINSAGGEIDRCEQNGSVPLVGACNDNFADDPGGNCGSGLICLFESGATVGFCGQMCDLTGTNTCGTGAECRSYDVDATNLGYCSDGGF